MDAKTKRRPTLLESLIPLVVIALFLGLGYGVLRLKYEILLILAAAVTGLIAIRLGFSYKEIEEGIVRSMAKGLPAMLIVIVVGALIGAWIVAGTIPMLIYFGLKLISPKFFLVTVCLVCSFISTVTGTSYGTVGTVGVAFIGIAHGLDVPLGQTAGAIVAGSYFGDKISPFSDTTNLAPIAAKSNLVDHIRHTLWTTTPAWLIGLIIYFFLGVLGHSDQPASLAKTDLILATIRKHYAFHFSLLLPPLVTLYFSIRKKPVIPGMFLSAGIAVILAISVQETDLKTAIASMVTGFKSQTGEELVDSLLTRGGMESMMDVTLIAFCAFAFGGIAQTAGMLDVLLERLTKVANTAGKLIACSVASTITVALITGSSFLSILIPGDLFAPAYKRLNLAAKNLSRTTEDSGTVVVPLIPWSIAGVFMSGTLGVDTVAYLPWAVMCYLGFVFALVYGFTGFAIAPRKRDDETIPGS